MNLKDSFGAIVSNRYFEWAITAIILMNAARKMGGTAKNVGNKTYVFVPKK